MLTRDDFWRLNGSGWFAACAASLAQDRDEVSPELGRWLFGERQARRGSRQEMAFDNFIGPEHLARFFGYLQGYDFSTDLFSPKGVELAGVSAVRDIDAMTFLGLDVPRWLAPVERIGLYNATDYSLLRALPGARLSTGGTVLDFGAGHGRQANLAFAPEAFADVSRMISVDAVPGSYTTALMYYLALGLEVREFLDQPGAPAERDDWSVWHLPTWRLNLVRSQSVDAVMAVQVLREVTRDVLVYALGQFAHVLKPGGVLYVRDHLFKHNPNGLNQDELIASHGFVLEWQPHVVDSVRAEDGDTRPRVHGIPRVWRRFDPSVLPA